MNDLNGKTLLITVGSRGIGEAIGLRAEGISDFSRYAVDGSQPLQTDLFL
ncbi:MAG: hypothetical protein L0Y38_03605 [Methylococcaceae bacterium]|nr:hypothetical protein [Methylococcaceae bacterium]